MQEYELTDNYGEMECGLVVEAREIGYDWIRVVHRGNAVYVPMHVVQSTYTYGAE